MRKIFCAVALVTLSLPLMTGCAAKAKITATVATPEPAPPPAPPPAPKEEPAPIKGDEIVMPEQIEFDVDKATIRNTEQSQRVLNDLASVLKKHPEITKVRIEGHTDNTGRARSPVVRSRHNAELSNARAESVVAWLVEQGIEKGRLSAVGLGDTKPVADNATAEGRQQNRRTEFHIVEKDGKPVDPSGVATTPKARN